MSASPNRPIPRLARCRSTFSRLSIGSSFELSNGRAWLIPMLALPVKFRLLALLPALFLATLFFLDQNITVRTAYLDSPPHTRARAHVHHHHPCARTRVAQCRRPECYLPSDPPSLVQVRTVNSPNNKLRKGAAYHLDLCVLGLLTGFSSIFGLPWMCSATVQSLNHVRAMTIFKKATGSTDGKPVDAPSRVIETRLTGFAVHAGILASALFIPALSCVPLAVVAGVFLYLGQRVMSGNQFLRRCKQIFIAESELCTTTEGEKEQVILGRAAVLKFTALQVLCLATLWALKLSPSTALIFPSVIGVLMVLRAKVVPRLFSGRELKMLDTAIGATEA
jgi:hypothetical protein